jgi:class 3 adenylate cyclase
MQFISDKNEYRSRVARCRRSPQAATQHNRGVIPLTKRAVIEHASASAPRGERLSAIRKIAAILVADVAGYSRLAGLDEDRTLWRPRGLRCDLIDPAIAAHHGRVVKRTGDGALVEFRSVVDAVGCAIEVQNAMVERNVGVSDGRRIEFHIGDASRKWTATSWATALISPRGSKASQRLVRFAFRKMPIGR